MNVDEKKAADLFERWRPWLEWQARYRSVDGVRVVDAAELLARPDAPSFVDERAEERYRRGYWHGYSQAIDDLHNACERHAGKWPKAWSSVAAFLIEALTRWAYERHGGAVTMPPRFGVKK